MKKDIYLVTCYHHDRAYGGHEEGGWYFDYYIPLCPGFEDKHSEGYEARVWAFTSEEKARSFVERMNAKLDYFINQHRPSVSSVCSRGEVCCFVSKNSFPDMEPKTKPHYE